MKTVCQALIDEVLYPIPFGKVINIIIRRGLDGDALFTRDVAESDEYKGAMADCLYTLIQAINFSEADKSVGTLTDGQRKAILKRANALYVEIGEEAKEDAAEPKVYINC